MAVSVFLFGYVVIALTSWVHTLVMPLLWLALFVAWCRWFAVHPRAVVRVPLLSVAVWLDAILTLG